LAAASGTKDIARRYAKAFFALANEGNVLAAVENDMTALSDLNNLGGDFGRFVQDTTLTRALQGKALQAIAVHLKLSPVTQKLLGVLAARRRLEALDAIVSEINVLIALQKGEVTADVTTAQALDQSQMDQLSALLKKSLGANSVRIKISVDPELIGGLVLNVGSRRVDASVRAKLDRLARALKQPQNSIDKNKMREVA